MSQTLVQEPFEVHMEGKVSYPPGTTVVEVVIPPGCDVAAVQAALEGIDGILISTSTA